jgi:hypothetical protein
MTSKSKQAEENSKDNNNNNNNNDQPTEKKHPVEAPISHSSWIHRLTTQKTNDAHSEEIKEEKQTVTKEECSSTEEQESSAEKDNENKTQLEQDSANKDPKKELQKSGDGSSIWSWFGYSNVSNNSATFISKDDEPVEEESIKLQSELDSAEQQASKKTSSIHDDSIEKEQEQDPDTASADQHHPKQSYWKSLFISSMSDDPKHSQKDSVIISDDSDEQSIQEEPKQHTKSFKSRKNVVLPTFESQFTAPTTESQPGFFNRALSAINSVFTSKTHDQDLFWKENDHLLSMVESMKKNPQNVANKRIVIIGVHGWFPMKVHFTLSLPFFPSQHIKVIRKSISLLGMLWASLPVRQPSFANK